jgi:1-acyl-sn-glycerol-3-phosphate acyltransferase
MISIPYFLLNCVLLWTDKIFFKIRYIKSHAIDPKQRYVYLSNHQTLLDAVIGSVALDSMIEQYLVSVVISYVRSIPLIGINLRLLGIPFLHYDAKGRRVSKGLVQMYSEFLQQNKSAVLAIFPEGKRVFNGEFKRDDLKSGGFVIAKNTGMDIVPVYHNLMDSVDDVKKEYKRANIFCLYGDPINVGDREIKEVMDEYHQQMIKLQNTIKEMKI